MMKESNAQGLEAEFHFDFSSPLLFTAIHNGHELRDEVKVNCALSDEDRLREEDPHTSIFTEIGTNRIILHTSRFEVDLNRKRERAVYLKPEDCWGLTPRLEEPSQEWISRSLDDYDTFYRRTDAFLDELIRTHGKVIVYDIHSYNHHRQGIEAPYDDPEQNPEIILGTSNMAFTWMPKIEQMQDKIRSYNWFGRSLDCRMNVKFTGGNFAQWIHHQYNENACVISIEFKKIFMNEWTGSVNHSLLNELKTVLATTLSIW
ncbi:MAG TPA: N-formylglutamate amidohydrolase [Candidatus Cloacimonadota bacterium]|nr:N-formylglutamate amidohydrolase [Candidatus Cloacimonadota bacterium]HPT70981.1 N-formylglutamate amidohydrolase [Candidatus Cloacimonadota bacterium]